MIRFDASRRLWHLQAQGFDLILQIGPEGDLLALHAGAPRDPAALPSPAAEPYREKQARDFAPFGNNDLRSPALLIRHPDGSRLSAFRYSSHEITENEALRITLVDEPAGQQLDLHFRIAEGVLLRWARLAQLKGSSTVRRLCSLSLDLEPGRYEALSLPGDWIRERQEQRTPLPQGLLKFESRRGISSHQMSPFVALGKEPLSEDHGGVFGVSLIYSGNWMAECEGHHSGGVRLNAGINDFDFEWELKAGESLETPQAVLAWSGEGLGGLSRKLHRFVRNHIIAPQWKGRPAPLLLNSWEACYFKFDHAKVIELAKGAKEIGAEMLVLDDGWFGRRDDDTTSMGDWYEDERKLPKGIKGLSEEVKALGLKFGLWFEPEAISPKSRLFEKHPDWAILPKGREATQARSQYVIDMSKPEVRDYLFERITHYIKEGKLDYIKWDMNRPLWETPHPSLPHKYVLGVYELMARIQAAFPNLLIEGCAGGGARFDYGILRYHPQFWASDNTDALDRIRIQWGSSYFLPPFTMGSHISEVPNHLTKRSLPLSLRAHVAMSGSLGLELDPSRVTAEERKELAVYLDQYRQIRHLILEGDFHRLEHPDSGRAAWAFVSQKQHEAVVFTFQMKEGEAKPVEFPKFSLQINPGLSGKAHESSMVRVRIPDG